MKRIRRNIFIIIATLLLFCSLTGCGSEPVVVNVENTEDINGTNFGKDVLIKIGNGLYYDATTRIVYWWNGSLGEDYMKISRCDTTPTPYIAPNGLPYKYNPETNTFVEIEVNVNE